MCETKAIVVSKSKILLEAAFFCIYQARRENKVGHNSKIRSQGPCENEYKKYCLNGGDCNYLVDEDIVDCNYMVIWRKMIWKVHVVGLG